MASIPSAKAASATSLIDVPGWCDGRRWTPVADRDEQRRNPEGVTMLSHERHDLRRVGSAS
jgi:hypothetical protein